MGKGDSEIVRLAEEHVFELFRDASTNHPLTYHGFRRSLDLVKICKDIAKGSELDGDDSQVLLLAAWFHDAGYAVTKDGIAGRSIEIARAFFASHGQPASLADAVVACLGAAEGEGVHDGLAGQALHDALLARLAGKNQVKAGELLRFEEERRNGRAYSDVEWTRAGSIAWRNIRI
jgi:HD superfamily phosphodiesterase